MILKIRNLSAFLDSKQILSDINLDIFRGKIHALMGPNGSGKSTLAQVLMGNANYELGIRSRLSEASQNSAGGIPQKAGKYELRINKRDIKSLKADERAREGLFLAFQNPTAIPGVSVASLLKTAYNIIHPASGNGINKKFHNPALSVWEFNEMLLSMTMKLGIPQEFLRRNLNEQFSGGEKKKLEMLQAVVLNPKFAIFDEIDTGLDVDALKIVAQGISEMKKKNTGILLITHYQRILHFAKPDFVHIMVAGKIVESGSYKLAMEIEKNGYKKWIKN